MINDASCEANSISNRYLQSGTLGSAVLQELREEIDELKIVIFHLNNEILKNRQRIMELEKKKKSYGGTMKQRVKSMLMLVEDYGGSLKSSSIKTYMGLSKDELYRALKCAREQGLIEVRPDPQDRRGYIISAKLNFFESNQKY